MPLRVTDIDDPALLEKCLNALKTAGYGASLREKTISVVGAGQADQSVDFTLKIVDLDGHRLIELSSLLGENIDSFERIALAVARGNMHCHTVSFSPVEKPSSEGGGFTVIAQSHLYADYLSDGELASMVYLYAKELDDIDNEIKSILSGA
jgi:hypothetical protein